jgi:formate C-acetyltransferase
MNEIIALFDSLASLYFSGGHSGTTQAVTIGGIDSEGKDSTNDLTYIILDAIEENLLPTPNLIVRRHEKMPIAIYEKIFDMLAKGINITAIVNDDAVIKALVRHNIPLEETRKYGIIGCVGLTVPGSFDNTGAAFLNLAKALEITLKTENSIVGKYIQTKKQIQSFYSMDDVLEAYKKNLRKIVEMVATLTNAQEEAQKKLRPTPLMSLCVDGCFEKGFDVNKGSAKYNFAGIYGTGFADVVDSLAALEKTVFKEHIVDMEDLNDALKSDFKGYEKLLHYLNSKYPKYGNDDDNADKYAQKIIEIFSEAVKGLKCTRGNDYRIGIHANCTHIGFGNLTGALPSGRRRGKPLSHDMAPIASMGGLTSSITSITKVNHSLISNGMACTLNINPKIVKMEDGKSLLALIETYFERGGLHIQFNAILPDTLKEAQKSPEKYQNLIVRVSGYSAKFVELSKAVQDEIISRYCHATN